jgi:Na+/melibiose symporter-like transporter
MASGVLANSDFRKLWAGQAVSQLGSAISAVALQFSAVVTLGATAEQVATLSAAGGFSILLFGLFAGAMADRVRRRSLMIAADLARAVALGTIPVAAWTGHLSMAYLYGVAAVTGALTVLFDSAYRAYLPTLVESDHLLDANAKLALSQSASEVGGPGVAGVLVRVSGAPTAILLDALSFLWSALCLGAVRKREESPIRTDPDTADSVWHEIGEGLSTAWHHPILRALALRNATGGYFLGFIGGLYFIFAIRELRLDTAVVGAIISFGGAFSLVGSATAQRFGNRFGLGRAMVGAAVASGIGSMLPGLAYGPVWVCAGFLCASQMFDVAWPVYGIAEATLIQSVTPNHLTGRVSSAIQLLFRGIFPLGSLTAGVLAEHIGLRGAMLAGAAGYLLSAGWLAGCRELRNWGRV